MKNGADLKKTDAGNSSMAMTLNRRPKLATDQNNQDVGISTPTLYAYVNGDGTPEPDDQKTIEQEKQPA